MSPAATPSAAETFGIGYLVASLGAYNLFYVRDDYYQIVGPDPQFPRAWAQAHLPAGDWVTRWSGDGELVVHITR